MTVSPHCLSKAIFKYYYDIYLARSRAIILIAIFRPLKLSTNLHAIVSILNNAISIADFRF